MPGFARFRGDANGTTLRLWLYVFCERASHGRIPGKTFDLPFRTPKPKRNQRGQNNRFFRGQLFTLVRMPRRTRLD